MTPRFGRVLTAMVTPFKDDLSMDFDRAGELALALIESGSDGVVVAGTTGESATLNMAEHGELFRVIRDAVGSRGLVIGGTGGNSTAECLELCHYAEKAGCDGALIVAPYYNKPSQEGIYQHFRHVAERTGLPILLYNIPGRCAVNMEPSTTARLAEIQNIIGIKEAAGSMDQVTDIIARTGADFAVYSGDDSLTLPMLSIGAVGVVSVAAHLAGAQILEHGLALELGEFLEDGEEVLDGGALAGAQVQDVPVALLEGEQAAARDVARERALADAGVTLLHLPAPDGRVDLRALLAHLAVAQCNEVLVEAGATLAGAALRAGLVDELIIYMAPTLMGSAARPLLDLPFASMDEKLGLQISDITAVGSDWRITASVGGG